MVAVATVGRGKRSATATATATEFTAGAQRTAGRGKFRAPA